MGEKHLRVAKPDDFHDYWDQVRKTVEEYDPEDSVRRLFERIPAVKTLRRSPEWVMSPARSSAIWPGNGLTLFCKSKDSSQYV